MRIRNVPLSLLIASTLVFASGWAGSVNADVEARPGTVPVYEMNPFVGKPYEVLGHIWADSWRTAFWLPTYPNKDDAIAAMQAEASRLNPDALIMVNCLDQRGSTWFRGNEPAYLCYGVAIKVARQG